MIDKIAGLLLEEFSSVYCNSCRYEGNDNECDGCHRKNMDWALSEGTAETIATDIIKLVAEEIEKRAV